MTDRRPTVTVVQRRRSLVIATILWPFLCFGVVFPAAFAAAPLAVGVLAVAVTLLLAFAVVRWPERRRGVLGVSNDHILLDGVPILRRADIRSGFTSTRNDGVTHVARLVQRGLLGVDVDFELGSASEAADFLREVGADRSRKTTRMIATWGQMRDVYRSAAAILLGAGAGVLTTVALGPAGLSTIALVFVLTMFVAVRSTVTIVVGSDGIFVERWLGQRRFVPYGEIAEVRVTNGQLEIRLHDETSLFLHLGYGASSRRAGLGVAMDDALFRVAGLASEILEAKRRSDELAATSERETTSLVHGSQDELAGFRDNAIPRERLWQIVEDPAAPVSARARAAQMLKASSFEAGSDAKRLRVAADACASPQLRVALLTGLDTQELTGEEAAGFEAEPHVDEHARRARRSRGPRKAPTRESLPRDRSALA